MTGVFLEAIGVYGPIADWGGAGATVPLTCKLFKFVRDRERGILDAVR